MEKRLTIGVLALQGAVEPHKAHIEAAGGQFLAVKTPKHFEQVDAFILPGGESTTMLKLIERFDLWNALSEQFAQKPVWGICAGCILIAKHVHYSHKRVKDQNGHVQKSFGLLPMTVERNGYGRQVDSHQIDVNGYTTSFIRAPIISAVQDDVEVLASHRDSPVWVARGQYMATTFHPELTLDHPSPMHEVFINLVNEDLKKKAA